MAASSRGAAASNGGLRGGVMQGGTLLGHGVVPKGIAGGRWEEASSADLRRRRSRLYSERLVERAAWLMPDDRAIIQAMFRDNLTASEVAALRGEPVRQLRRRVRSLVTRMGSSRFEYVVRQRESWPTMRRRVATAVVLQGRSLREAAEHLQMSFHCVRKEMQVVSALSEAVA